MWPAGLPRALPFFAMVALTPHYLLLNPQQCSQCNRATEPESAPPIHLMHKDREIHHFRPSCHFLPEREVLPWQQPTKEEVWLLWSNSSQPVLRNNGDRDEPSTPLSALVSPGPATPAVQTQQQEPASGLNPHKSPHGKHQNTSIVWRVLISQHIRWIRKIGRGIKSLFPRH